MTLLVKNTQITGVEKKLAKVGNCFIPLSFVAEDISDLHFQAKKKSSMYIPVTYTPLMKPKDYNHVSQKRKREPMKKPPPLSLLRLLQAALLQTSTA